MYPGSSEVTLVSSPEQLTPVVIERTGQLIESHPSLFVVEVEEGRGRKARQSYQYVDVLTNTVELSDPDTGESLLASLKEG